MKDLPDRRIQTKRTKRAEIFAQYRYVMSLTKRDGTCTDHKTVELLGNDGRSICTNSRSGTFPVSRRRKRTSRIVN